MVTGCRHRPGDGRRTRDGADGGTKSVRTRRPGDAKAHQRQGRSPGRRPRTPAICVNLRASVVPIKPASRIARGRRLGEITLLWKGSALVFWCPRHPLLGHVESPRSRFAKPQIPTPNPNELQLQLQISMLRELQIPTRPLSTTKDAKCTKPTCPAGLFTAETAEIAE